MFGKHLIRSSKTATTPFFREPKKAASNNLRLMKHVFRSPFEKFSVAVVATGEMLALFPPISVTY